MRQFSEIFRTVLDKTVLDKLEQHREVYTIWEQIVKESFASKKERNELDAYTNGAYITPEIEEMIRLTNINIINGNKAADHSAIKQIKNNTLYVESDHQGWIQILQTKQHRIMNLLNKAFPELKLNAIVFVLANSAEKPPENAIPEAAPKPPAETTAERLEFEEAIAHVQDEGFKELLRKLKEKRGVKAESRQSD